MECCLIEDPLDLYYLTGVELSSGSLLIHCEEIKLFVDGRYIQVAKELAPVSVDLFSANSFREFFSTYPVRALHFDGRSTCYDRLEQLRSFGVDLVSSSHFFKKIRVVKDPLEIKAMKESASFLCEGFKWIVSSLKVGVTEKEIAKGFEIFCLTKGADRLAFDPIIAFGKNSAMPHYKPQEIPLKKGDVVLIDIGVVLHHYHSDMTRVIVDCQENPSLHALYEIVQKAQRKALEICRPGTTFGQLDQAVRDHFRQENVEKLFVHSLGHGIGLATHEFPRIKWDGEDKDVSIEPGMVFTVEPGLYLPGVGGVRYEDTIVITENGYENFYFKYLLNKY